MNGLGEAGAAAAEWAAAEQAAAGFASHSRAAATLRAYQVDWTRFAAWCARHGRVALPAAPGDVALFLAAEAASCKTATLQHRLAAIIVRHRQEGLAFDAKAPALVEVWRGIRRVKGVAKQGKAPLLGPELAAILAALPDTLAGKRDRALLALTFSAALRRSEAVALDVGDLTWTSAGVVVRVARAKTDPDGKGASRAVPKGRGPGSCPVAALKAWVTAAGLDEGPLFRPVDKWDRLGAGRICDRTLVRIVKKAVETYGRRQGWSRATIAAKVGGVAGHSLRAGFATTAAAAGAEEWAIMKQTGHKKRESVQGYIRAAVDFDHHIGHQLGL